MARLWRAPISSIYRYYIFLSIDVGAEGDVRAVPSFENICASHARDLPRCKFVIRIHVVYDATCFCSNQVSAPTRPPADWTYEPVRRCHQESYINRKLFTYLSTYSKINKKQ